MSQLHPSPSRAFRRTGSFLLLALMTLQLSVVAPGAQAAPKPKPPKTTILTGLVPTVSQIAVVNGQLFASGTVTATVKGATTTVPFSGVPVNISLAPNRTGAGACPILDLTLGPIELNLLGLVVETSPICLEITAFEGGGLLGDLLCAVANLLDGGLSLGQILGGQGLTDPVTGGVLRLSGEQVNSLISGLPNLLNQALQQLLNAILDQILPGGACGILHLELGPLTLNLLGLEVVLDDCNGGPVIVDITAQPGPGNLLGNLLCELLDGGLLGGGLTLGQILDLIRGLLTQ